MQIHDTEGLDPVPAPADAGYELLAITTASITVGFVGLIPSIVTGNVQQLPFCLMGMALIAGAVLAHGNHHPIRFWAFITASMLLMTSF